MAPYSPPQLIFSTTPPDFAKVPSRPENRSMAASTNRPAFTSHLLSLCSSHPRLALVGCWRIKASGSISDLRKNATAPEISSRPLKRNSAPKTKT